MRDILKSFLMGIGFAVGFFLAISFTADAEDMAAEAEQAEYAMYLQGLQDGAREATVNRPDQWRCMFASK